MHPSLSIPGLYCRLFAALLICLASAPAWAGSPVWRITSADHALYIGGTIHMLSKEDYPLPAAFNHAYATADTLVFETDMGPWPTLKYSSR